MKKHLFLVFHLSLFVLASLKSISLRTLTPPRWGAQCPMECQCHPMSLAQTLMSRWFSDERDVKTALCVLQRQTQPAKLLSQVPHDTEVLTLLQASDAPSTMLNATMMQHLKQLRGLDIQGSYQRPVKISFDTKAFSPLKSLQYLSLIRVDLSSAHKVFANLKVLQNLQVTESSLGGITWNLLQGLDSLKDLYLSHNDIHFLEDFAFYGTPALERLLLSYNKIFSLHMEAFLGLLKLEMLDLSSNQIDHLSELTFPPMPQLQWLDLKNNPISTIFPNCFRYLNSTKKLHLGSMKQSLYFSKFSFNGLESLESLVVPNADLDILLEHTFYGLHKLRILSIKGRVLVLGKSAFMGAHYELRELYLSSSNLTKLFTEAFFGLSKLEILDLSENNLTILPSNVFDALESLQELNLSQNKIKFLMKGTLIPLQGIQMIRTDQNPWNCTCSMKKWNEDIMTKKHGPTPPCIFENLKCADLGPTYVTDHSVAPRCKYPTQYQDMSIFDAVQEMCNDS